MSSPLFDLLLLGYRNELARERVVAYLRSLPDTQGGPVEIDRTASLPWKVRADIDHDAGLRLLGELRERGAHVRLVAGGDDAHRTAPAARAPALPSSRVATVTPKRPRGPGAWTPLWLMLLGGAALVYQHLQPMPRPLPPPMAELYTEPQSPFGIRVDAGPHRLNDEAVALNAAGHFADAADKLRAAVAEAPDEPSLRHNLQTVLHNWAVAELNGNRLDSAVELLEEALTLDEDPALLSTLGVARVRQDDWRDARTALERAVALGATDPHTFVSLGKVYRQQGEREAAVEMFHRARENGARGADFDDTLRRLERELDAEWDFAQMRSPHFDIAFAGGGRESNAAAQAVAQGLENAYFHAGRKLDRYPEDRIPVVLYPSEDFHDVTQTPNWTGGVYDGRIKLPSRGVEDQDPALLERTLRHEYAHVLITQLSRGRVPVWLNEGVAIWCEEDRDGEREEWALRTLAGQVLFPLRNLEGSFTALPPERVHAAYAQSYLAVRELVTRAGGHGLRDLLTALGQGQRFEDAFRAVYGETVASFEVGLIRALTG